MTDSEFALRYPEHKPICFNYFTAREDVLALRGENHRLREENSHLRERFAAIEEASKALVYRNGL